jgi:DNA polymerase I-like protein with 3'-5' exonuclease and polymerase domains
MRIIKTHEMDPRDLSEFEKDQIYNGLDVCCTRDVFDAIHPQLDEITNATYQFSLALQAPTLEMRVRGVLVDQTKRQEVIDEYYDTLERLESNLNRIVFEGIGLPSFNWRSPADLRGLFYDTLGLPVVRRQGRPTVDRAAREHLAIYPIATPLISHINALTEIGDKISVLKTAVDSDGRIRTSYNIAGTNTGRFSSSLSEFGTGGNLQNIEESLRSVFIADRGFKFAKCDAKSGESFAVGAIEWNLFHDPRYLDVCESGDPHTAVARICWPGLGWTGDLQRDKNIAETPYYRHHSHRFMCKKLGHGSNYGGQPQTLAEQAKLPVDVVKQFQPKYFSAFPAHKLWQEHVAQTLRSTGCLTSLLGRRRYFLGRRGDPDTLRGAIAYDPQSSLADIVNRAMLQVWRKDYVSIMLHDHDALTFQYPEHLEDQIISRIMNDLIVPVQLAQGRMLKIPYDCCVGWNKGNYDPNTNPNGLKEYHGHDDRKRIPEQGLLDKPYSRKAKAGVGV